MKVVIQRVKKAAITIGDDQVAAIGKGLVVLVGCEKGDGEEEAAKVVKKVLETRVFENAAGTLWESSVKDVGGEVLCVSQFTLLASVNKGTKPNFRPAMGPTEAEPLYQRFVQLMRDGYVGDKVSQGIFGSTCDVMLVNDGPTTILYETGAASKVPSVASSRPASTTPGAASAPVGLTNGST